MLELMWMGENLKRAGPAEMCALLDYYAPYGGNLEITAICCAISQKSADLIFLAAEA
jgi:hypothetical protein